MREKGGVCVHREWQRGYRGVPHVSGHTLLKIRLEREKM